jgi:hypothetical protein
VCVWLKRPGGPGKNEKNIAYADSVHRLFPSYGSGKISASLFQIDLNLGELSEAERYDVIYILLHINKGICALK